MPSDRLGEIRTQRRVLARLCAADLNDLVEMYRDPLVMATLGGIRTPAETAEYLARHVDHWEQYGFGWWAARDRITGQFIGRGGLRYWSIEGRQEVEVGYGLLPEFWGRNLATEFAMECVRVAFADLRFRELVAFTLPTNLGSRRVLEKAGFRFDRDIIHSDEPHVLYRQTLSECSDRKCP